MRARKQRGVTLMIGTMSLIFLVPLIGLGIDVGFLFAVKSKLQASMDGATLGAARALNIGQTTGAQAATAQGHAVNWFHANFPNAYFGTYNTTMSTSNVNVFDDPNNPHLRHVQATATTTVDTFFMRWFGYTSTVIGANSDATRRDAVIMMVLDRSGSMGASCADLKNAAKLFTGQFAAGRDYIGAVSFSDGAYLHTTATTNFQSVLGFTNDYAQGSGQLDNIQCNGGTGTAQAIAWAYGELNKTNLPGALNIMMFETDGLPNTLTFNWWDAANSVAGLANASPCRDATNVKTMSTGGFNNLAALPNWTNGHVMASSVYPNVPAGIVGAMYSNDPFQGAGFILMFNPFQASYSTGNNSSYVSNAGNCTFNGSHNNITDLAWTPMKDVYGNQLYPGLNPYQGAITTLGGGKYLSLAGSTSTAWTNYHNAVLNATDNAAYQARVNATIPAYVFGIGLGGNAGDGPDYVLMQRLANDPNGDLYNTTGPLAGGAYYLPCSQEPTCYNYTSQQQGKFIFAYNNTQLVSAFLSISSQILRLSR
jgi:Flp pilus assembly protein TadG